jgi:hypothetical protein
MLFYFKQENNLTSDSLHNVPNAHGSYWVNPGLLSSKDSTLPSMVHCIFEYNYNFLYHGVYSLELNWTMIVSQGVK